MEPCLLPKKSRNGQKPGIVSFHSSILAAVLPLCVLVCDRTPALIAPMHHRMAPRSAHVHVRAPEVAIWGGGRLAAEQEEGT